MSRSSLFCAVAILARALLLQLFGRDAAVRPELPEPGAPSWSNPIPQSEQ